MLSMNLSPIFSLRGIEKPFSYLVNNGFPRHTAHRLIHGKSRVFRFDHIEKLCDLLVCEPNDLLVWTPNDKQNYPDNYPLLKLKKQDITDLKETLTKTPLSELKAVADNIIRRKE